MDSDSGTWFSLRRFGAALGIVGLGAAAGNAVVPWFGSYVGLLAGSFAAGLAFEDRPFFEAGLAGLLVGVPATLLGNLFKFALGGLGPEMLLLGAVLGFGLGALGAHLGNDFRDGLTRPVEDRPR